MLDAINHYNGLRPAARDAIHHYHGLKLATRDAISNYHGLKLATRGTFSTSPIAAFAPRMTGSGGRASPP